MKTVTEKLDDSFNSFKYLIYFLSIKLATTSRLFDPKFKVMIELLDQHSFFLLRREEVHKYYLKFSNEGAGKSIYNLSCLFMMRLVDKTLLMLLFLLFLSSNSTLA